MPRPLRLLLAAAALGWIVMPAVAPAQFSGSIGFRFLQAVRDAKGDDVTAMLNEPGNAVIDSRDTGTGEGALHIVVRRSDATYLRFLLQRGADANLRDNRGNTPLMLAVTQGDPGIVQLLLDAHANVNLANASGETPLIRAVQRHDLDLARLLLGRGADPDQHDTLAGMSARDYAHQDTRSPALRALIDQSAHVNRAAVAGPHL